MWKNGTMCAAILPGQCPLPWAPDAHATGIGAFKQFAWSVQVVCSGRSRRMTSFFMFVRKMLSVFHAAYWNDIHTVFSPVGVLPHTDNHSHE